MPADIDDYDDNDTGLYDDLPEMTDEASIEEASAELAELGIRVEPSADPEEFLRHLCTALRTHKATKARSKVPPESATQPAAGVVMSRLARLEREVALERAANLSRAAVPQRPRGGDSLSRNKVKAILDWKFQLTRLDPRRAGHAAAGGAGVPPLDTGRRRVPRFVRRRRPGGPSCGG